MQSSEIVEQLIPVMEEAVQRMPLERGFAGNFSPPRRFFGVGQQDPRHAG